MSGKQELESYLVTIAKKYMVDHPDVNVKATKRVEIPLNECEYCSKNPKAIFEIPFSDTCVKVVADKLSVSCSCGFEIDENINFCPKCGRELNT